MCLCCTWRHGPELVVDDRRDSQRSLPTELAALIEATDDDASERAWSEFVAVHSSLILRTARSVSPDYDDAMDRYAFVIERLRVRNFRRLRAFAAEGRGSFPTWLAVVVRRLSFDYHRRRYGRVQDDENPDAAQRWALRRRLADLVGAAVDVEQLGAPSEGEPERQLRRKELLEVLGEAIASLSPRDQLLLAMRFEDERPIDDIVQLMNFSSRFQAYRRLKRATGELRVFLRARGIRSPRP